MVVGWYHSHPGSGFGCWLSGVDINTQWVLYQFPVTYDATTVKGFKHMQHGDMICMKVMPWQTPGDQAGDVRE
ncbi:hypothetical protein Tco_1135860 [Tanacetum coccineum]